MTVFPGPGASAVSVSRVHSILRLVLREVVGLAFRFYLGARDVAAHPRGSDDEPRLEVYVADGVHLHHFRRGLALCRTLFDVMALVLGGHRRRLMCSVALSL